MQSCKSLMVEHFTLFSVIESEVEGKHVRDRNDSNKEHEIGHLTMTMSVERIITKFVSVWLIVCVWLINNQVGVRVRREYILVTK